MKNLKIFIMTMFVMFITTSMVLAEPHPSRRKPVSHVTQVDDLDTLITKTDSEMESAYVKATLAVTEGSNEQTNLIETQRIWKVYRALMNEVVKEMNKDMGSYGDVIIKKHYIGVTKRRAEELRFISTGPEDPPVAF